MREPRHFAPIDPPSPTEPVDRPVTRERTEPSPEEHEDAERIREQTERAQEKIHQQIEAAARIMGEGADITLRIEHSIFQLSHKQEPPMRWVGLQVISRLAATNVDAFIEQVCDQYIQNLFAVNSGYPRHEQYKFPEGPMLTIVSLAAENGQSFNVFPDGIETVFASLKELDDKIDASGQFVPPEFVFIDNETGEPEAGDKKIWRYHDVQREMEVYQTHSDNFPNATIQCVRTDLLPGHLQFLEKHGQNIPGELLSIDRLELQAAAGEDDWEAVAAMDADELVKLFIQVFGRGAADGQLEQRVRELYEQYWADIKAHPKARRFDSDSYTYINYFLQNIFDYTITIERDWGV